MMQRPDAASIVRRTLLACAVALAAVSAHARDRHSLGTKAAGRFDYYLVSLSWSPSYCLVHRNDREQCGRRGFGFVLHGLWPQYRNGRSPQYCDTHAAPDPGTVARTLAFMPSRRLIEHEWRAHGSCSGLGPREYFETADRAFSAITIPAALRTPRSPPSMTAGEIRRAFVGANPGLRPSMLGIACHDGGEFTEVRLCLDRNTLAPRACGGRVRDSCRYGRLRIPGAR